MCELLWSDPQPQLGRGPSKRGVGLSFGGDVTKRFLEDNNLGEFYSTSLPIVDCSILTLLINHHQFVNSLLNTALTEVVLFLI